MSCTKKQKPVPPADSHKRDRLDPCRQVTIVTHQEFTFPSLQSLLLGLACLEEFLEHLASVKEKSPAKMIGIENNKKKKAITKCESYLSNDCRTGRTKTMSLTFQQSTPIVIHRLYILYMRLVLGKPAKLDLF